ncbi:MAG: nucleoside deaminase [Candidatus Aureabacteria bacterium]|nr:nucleoside deaminase [Candidatus Auribacterota bacterium]
MFNDEYWMRKAVQESLKAFEEGEVPVGAVIIKGNKIIAKASNQVEKLGDPTAHAEMIAITQACENLGDWRLDKCSLYVTKEPCIMCAGAIRNARIQNVYFSIRDEKEGACGSRFDLLRDEKLGFFANVRSGLLEDDVRDIFSQFFKNLRKRKTLS